MCPPSHSGHGATSAAAVTSPAASAPASLCAPALSSPTPARRAFCPNPNFPSPGLWALGPGVALVPLANPWEKGLASAGLPPSLGDGRPECADPADEGHPLAPLHVPPNRSWLLPGTQGSHSPAVEDGRALLQS